MEAMKAILALEAKTKAAFESIMEEIQQTKKVVEKSLGKRPAEAEPSAPKKLLKPSDLYLGPQKTIPTKRDIVRQHSYSAVTSRLFDEDDRSLKMTVLGSIPRAEKMPGFKPVIKELPNSFKPADFDKQQNYLRTVKFEDCKGIFPSGRVDKFSLLKADVTPGADASMVYKFFCLGLIRNIFLSEDMAEISLFPVNFQKSISEFLKRTKSKQQVCLKIHSVIPDWDDNGCYIQPYQLVHLSTIQAAPILTKSEPLGEMESTDYFRDKSILIMYEELKRLRKLKNFKINYDAKHIFMFSSFKKEAKDKEIRRLNTWIDSVLKIYLPTEEAVEEPRQQIVPTEEDKGGPPKEAPHVDKSDGHMELDPPPTETAPAVPKT